MDAIRPETELDRTQAALSALGLKLPLRHGIVEIVIDAGVAETPGGQRLAALLINALARMKGIVNRVNVVGAGEQPVFPETPLRGSTLAEGLQRLVASLNSDDSERRAELRLSPAADPAARVRIGGAQSGDIAVGADGWRAFVGSFASDANWSAPTPYGSAMAAALAAAEAFKHILLANGAADPAQRLAGDVAFSTFNHGVGADAAEGPALESLTIQDVCVAGCGAGGSAALYVLAMQPGLAGDVALIEPGSHKPSNLNRYLMSTAADVRAGRHKLSSAVDHLATFAPRLRPTLYAAPWEQLDGHPWNLVLSTVDTVEARWAMQDRCNAASVLLDGAVMNLLYSVLRVAPGGWCLECKHPYDSELPFKQRAARWGQTVETIRAWTASEATVSRPMVVRLAETQGRPVEDFAPLMGVPFGDTARLTECGETALRTDVPSQAPVLPLATTPVGALLAAEVAKHFAAPEMALANWLAHDLLRAPGRPRVRWRPALPTCPRHTNGDGAP